MAKTGTTRARTTACGVAAAGRLLSGCAGHNEVRATADSSIAITGDIHGHVSPDVAREAIEMLGDAFDQ